jgi:hypothetical protein
VKTIVEHLKYYDIGFWTTYDLVQFNPDKHPRMPCSIYYQNLHVQQMQAMYRLTFNPIFKTYEEKWRSQLNNKFYKTLSQFWKVYFKLRWF